MARFREQSTEAPATFGPPATILGPNRGIAPFAVNDAHSFLHNLFMTHMLFMDHLTWNKPSWSISAEFWTYVLYAALAFTLRRRPRAFLLASGLIAAMGFHFLLSHDMSAHTALPARSTPSSSACCWRISSPERGSPFPPGRLTSPSSPSARC
ncbi:hypothetical protein [Marimonas lutisalis]|uniref:hypothetical protein n=1 Tax=Marimonas lutisalis TaxID=2545756 RepID=UPI0013756DC0|nr:hypothetical protein [Marimonas lutisalis]